MVIMFSPQGWLTTETQRDIKLSLSLMGFLDKLPSNRLNSSSTYCVGRNYKIRGLLAVGARLDKGGIKFPNIDEWI